MIALNGVVKQYQGQSGPFSALDNISVHIKKVKNSALSVRADRASRRFSA